MTVNPDMIQSVDRIRFKIVLQYYSDVFRGFANREHLGPLIKRLETRMPQIKRVLEVSQDPILASPLTVVSLRGVNLDMRKVIPLLICRQLYDMKKSSPGSSDYLNIVIDEAHNILSSASARESEAWKDYRLETFEEIIKEGREIRCLPYDRKSTTTRYFRNDHFPASQLLLASPCQQPRHFGSRTSCFLLRSRVVRVVADPSDRLLRIVGGVDAGSARHRH